VIDDLLARARASDDHAFRELVEPHLAELRLHCYRMLGSLTDAEDALQDTLLAAWRGIGTYQGRASWRTWLYHVATNRCLNIVRDRGRRKRTPPVPPFQPPEPSRHNDITWLEPYPDALFEHVAEPGPGPETRIQQREAVELAFVTALQRMPPRQAAALVLRDVLGFHTSEVAAMLGITPTAVKGVLSRARAGAVSRDPSVPDADRELSRRFAEAFVADDIAALVAMLTDDAWLTMPPAPHAYHGRAAIAGFLRASAAWRGDRRFVLMPAGANTQPAYACYLPEQTSEPDRGIAHPAGLVVLTPAAGGIGGITRFLDVGLFAQFGLPEAVARP
jgi:RNA polymerase sigma-70 factor (TIGR02960 family)